MRLFIEPTDVWLFRDGRPFDADSDHRAASLFPPPPSVIQGALRAAHLAFRGVTLDAYASRAATDIENEIGAPGESPRFALHGPFLAQNREGQIVRYLRLPADATRVTGGYRSLAPRQQTDLRTNLPPNLSLLWRASDEPVGPETPTQHKKDYRWVREDALVRYLQDEQAISLGDACEDADLFERESRFGIRLDYAVRRPTDAALYEAEFVRVRPGVGVDVHVDGLSGWPNEGLLKLGGEGHMARYRMLDAEASALPVLTPRFKIYFAAPACFEHGWRRDKWDKLFAGKMPQLVAAAVRRFESRGGFDLFRNEHKSAHRYVPAGSVYYFEGDASTQLITSNVTDTGAESGFGQILIGRWDYV